MDRDPNILKIDVYRGFKSEDEKQEALGAGISPMESLFQDRLVRPLEAEAVVAVFAPNDVIRHVADIREKKKRFKSFSKVFDIAKRWATSLPDSGERSPGYVARATLHLELISTTGRANHVYRCQYGCLWINPLQTFPMPALRTGMDDYRRAYQQNSYSFAFSRQQEVFDGNQEWLLSHSNAERDQEMLLVHGSLEISHENLQRVSP
jgi:hypothetical protein